MDRGKGRIWLQSASERNGGEMGDVTQPLTNVGIWPMQRKPSTPTAPLSPCTWMWPLRCALNRARTRVLAMQNVLLLLSLGSSLSSSSSFFLVLLARQSSLLLPPPPPPPLSNEKGKKESSCEQEPLPSYYLSNQMGASCQHTAAAAVFVVVCRYCIWKEGG